MLTPGSPIDISPLVPERYAVYRPVIAAAFAYFLDHLAPHRRVEIYADTLSMVGQLLAGEIHLDREQAHMREAGALYDGPSVAILDWSLVGRLGKSEREQMVQVLLGALRLDRAAIASSIRALSETEVRETALVDAVDKALAGLSTGRPPGFRWLLSLLDEVALRAGAGFGES